MTANKSGRLISLAGIIGAGKTTTAKLLSEAMGAELIVDNHELNPFLAKVYEDPGRYAIENDLFFLAMFYHLLRESDPQSDAVSDFCLGEAEAFFRLRYQDAVWDQMMGLAGFLAERMRRSDLVIYLDLDIDVAYARITERAARERPFEADFPRQLLVDLAAAYDAHLSALGDRVIVLPVGEMDSPQDVADRCLEIVESARSGWE